MADDSKPPGAAPVPAPAAAEPAAPAKPADTAPSPAPATDAAANRPAPNTASIEVDEEEVPPAAAVAAASDDEGYAASVAGSNATTSLASSVRDYAFENNRRYHKFHAGKYHFPNDEPEQAREDMRHSMMVHLCGGTLHYAPLANPQKVLDIGTGTGIWAIDMGDEYPEAEVVGIDLSPIQPSWVPANVRFLVDDAEQPWVTPPDTYDYIHIRNMATAIKNWDSLFAEVLAALKPGGWVEIQDLHWYYRCDDDTMPPGYAVARMSTLIGEALAAFGIKMHSPEDNPARLAQAGFQGIRHLIDKVPIGPWPRDPKMKMIGLYSRVTGMEGLQGIAMGPLTRGLHWTPQEVEALLVDVRRDLMDTRIHSYVHMHTLFGQKPY